MKFIDDWLEKPGTPSGHMIGFAIGNSIGIAFCLGLAIWSLYFA